MKKLILKTALFTLLGCLAGVAVLGAILSFAAPGYMMELTASLGMENASGNFAWMEYGRTGDIDCLARSFVIAAEQGDDTAAKERFRALSKREDLASYCASVDLENAPYGYYDYLMGTGAKVLYRSAEGEEEKEEALSLAAGATDPAFPAGNPLIALSAEAVSCGDSAFCSKLLLQLTEGGYEQNKEFNNIVKLLEDKVHE